MGYQMLKFKHPEKFLMRWCKLWERKSQRCHPRKWNRSDQWIMDQPVTGEKTSGCYCRAVVVIFSFVNASSVWSELNHKCFNEESTVGFPFLFAWLDFTSMSIVDLQTGPGWHSVSRGKPRLSDVPSLWTSVSNCCPQLFVHLCLWAKEQALMSFNDSFTTKSKLNWIELFHDGL